MLQNSTFLITGLFLVACTPKAAKENPKLGGSTLSSVVMEVPPALKTSIGPDKINAYSLEIKGGTCDQSGSATSVSKPFAKLSIDDLLANEKIKKGCEYTIILMLGKADAAGTKLEKIYLTNNLDGKQTVVSSADSRADKVRVIVTLLVTEDGQKDLGITPNPVPVPSVGEVDAILIPSIGGQSSGGISDYDWRKEAKWASVPKSAFNGNSYGSAFYKDVMEHTSPSQRHMRDSRSTQAHETHHGLVAEMRNRTTENDAFVYFEAGNGIYVPRPKIHLNKIKNYLSPSFSTVTTRYDLYLVGAASSWEDPLYLFDEWNAYVATTRTAVELVQSKQWDNENSDPVDGLGDFLFFGSAVVAALKDLDPEYLKNKPEFKVAYALLAEQTILWSNEALKVDSWKNSKMTKRLEMLRTNSDHEALRKSIREFMGEAWTKRVLGF